MSKFAGKSPKCFSTFQDNANFICQVLGNSIQIQNQVSQLSEQTSWNYHTPSPQVSRSNSSILFQAMLVSILSVFCEWLYFQEVLRPTVCYFDDTVSSVGLVRGKVLPGTNNPDYIHFFHHTLALDKYCVKFPPKYAQGSVYLPCEKAQSKGRFVLWKPAQWTENGEQCNPADNAIPPEECIKEFWFAGSHSDMYI